METGWVSVGGHWQLSEMRWTMETGLGTWQEYMGLLNASMELWNRWQ